MKINKVLMDITMRNGGGTFTRSLEDANLKKGFMVSLPDHEQVVSLKEAHTISITDMVTIAKDLNAYIGTWLDDGKIYIDLSVNINNIEDAKRIGRENNQLAIYDVYNKMVIRL